MLNAVNALPQLEQADKLIARMPPAKWAAEMQTAASEFLPLAFDLYLDATCGDAYTDRDPFTMWICVK